MQPGAELLLLRACLGVGDGTDRVVWHAFAQWLWLADGVALSTAFGRLAVWLPLGFVPVWAVIVTVL